MQICYARYADQRSTTFQKALEVGEQYERNTQAMLLRVNLMRADFVVKPPPSERDRDAGGPERMMM